MPGALRPPQYPSMEHRPPAHAVIRPPASPSRHQRVDGAARVAFGTDGIRDLYQRSPCRLLFPDTEPSDLRQAVSITTSGGLTGGDKVRLEIAVDAHARGTVTTQAAEKLYRVLPDDPDIRIETRIEVGEAGVCEWLAQEAILFDRSRVRRSLHVDLGPAARMLAVESLVFGRSAMGESFTTGLIHDAWRIRRNGRLIWADALHIDGDFAAVADRPFGFGGARAIATIVYAGTDAADHLELGRTLAGAPSGGATAMDLLILRLIDHDARALRDRVIRAASALRTAALTLPPRLPAVWYC